MKTTENVLSMYMWGIEPQSTRRRFRYRLRFWLPFVCFCLLWMIFAVFLDGIGRERWLVATVLTAAVIGVGRIVLRIFLDGTDYRFRSNWQDYKLAGISDHDVFWFHCQPAFRCGAWLSVLSLGVAVLISIPHIGDWIHNGLYWTLFMELIFSGFLLTGGVLLDTTAWLREGRMGSRIVALAILLLFCLAVFTIFTLLIWDLLGVAPLSRIVIA